MNEEIRCHASCKRSKNVGPFAGCKCRCGGRMHASETLAGMSPAAFRAARRQMQSDVKLGASLVDARTFFAVQLRHDHDKRGAA